jgi:hypothetical protein
MCGARRRASLTRMPHVRAALAATLVIFGLLGCGGSSSKPSDTVFTSGGVDSHGGERVSVRGIYSLIDSGKHDADQPPVYDGHAVIILEDGTRVLLEPLGSPNSIRPEEEINRFAGRMVVVTGVLTKLPPPQPDHPQDAVMPCITKIEEIRLQLQ